MVVLQSNVQSRQHFTVTTAGLIVFNLCKLSLHRGDLMLSVLSRQFKFLFLINIRVTDTDLVLLTIEDMARIHKQSSDKSYDCFRLMTYGKTTGEFTKHLRQSSDLT